MATFPAVPFDPGVPPVPRAPADAAIGGLLASAAAGVVPPVLSGMISGAVPSMLNSLGSSFVQSASNFQGLFNQLTGGSQLTGDGSGIAVGPGSAPQWGIFDSSNNPVITPDTVLEFAYSTDYRVEDYPTEDGGFQSFNKVTVPFEITLTLAKGGTVDDRQAFIQSIESVKGSLKLYSVATPEFSYPSVTIVHADYDRRSDQGAAIIVADIRVQQIVATAQAAYSNTQVPTSQAQSNDGTVQATPPTSAQAAAAATTGAS